MAFKNLEERFNAKVNDLYDGAKLKFDGGRASTGINDNPLMVRRPGENRFGLKYEGRSIPFNSAPRDVVRLSLFSVSTRGLAFYVKQQLLQTGNTFEAKRLINPLFVIANGIPFLHVRRHLDPPFSSLRNFISAAFKINPSPTDTNYNNVKKLGQLQVGTYNKWKNERIDAKIIKRLISPIINLVSAFTAKNNIGEVKRWSLSRPELGADGYVVKKWLDSTEPVNFDFGLATRIGGIFGKVFAIQKYIDNFGNAEKNSSFLHGGKIKPDGVGADLFTGSRYGVTLTRYSKIEGGIFRGYASSDYITASNIWKFKYILGAPDSAIPKNNRTRLLSEEPARAGLDVRYTSFETEPEKKLDITIENFQENTDNFLKQVTNDRISTQPFLKYFTAGPESIISRIDQMNARDRAADARSEGRRISYIRDPLNERPRVPSENILPSYRNYLKTITENGDRKEDDPIVVSFAMGDDEHVQFRAFIKDLNQSISPDYKTYQYIGRIEKFIMYNSVQRQVSFKLGLLAFGEEELPIVWKRLNYLTSFMFPYGFNKGILQPNIIRFTIGNVFDNQPGYVTSFSTNFSEVSESWDITQQVPIAATVNMTFMVIEKDTKWADKSFYGITESMGGEQSTPPESTPPQSTLPQSTATQRDILSLSERLSLTTTP